MIDSSSICRCYNRTSFNIDIIIIVVVTVRVDSKTAGSNIRAAVYINNCSLVSCCVAIDTDAVYAFNIARNIYCRSSSVIVLTLDSLSACGLGCTVYVNCTA